MNILCVLFLIFSQALAQPTLPLARRDIPPNLSPPLNHGRVSVHGWLWLPTVQPQSETSITGYFYHHTPEFFHDSPHDFEIMVRGTLSMDKNVPNLPFPPSANASGSPLVGTEYVFTPPEFSLDDLITSYETKYYGKFMNGSFDTKQRYLLSMATFNVEEVVNVHYLAENQSVGYQNQVYLSYPRQSQISPEDELVHLYLLHLLEKSPDFDQIVHVAVNLTTCAWDWKQTPNDLIVPGATFLFPNIANTVMNRLYPSSSPVSTVLVAATQFDPKSTKNYNGRLPMKRERTAKGNSEASRFNPNVEYVGTQCQMQVLEEIHCVTVPDSFANCPPMSI